MASRIGGPKSLSFAERNSVLGSHPNSSKISSASAAALSSSSSPGKQLKASDLQVIKQRNGELMRKFAEIDEAMGVHKQAWEKAREKGKDLGIDQSAVFKELDLQLVALFNEYSSIKSSGEKPKGEIPDLIQQNQHLWQTFEKLAERSTTIVTKLCELEGLLSVDLSSLHKALKERFKLAEEIVDKLRARILAFKDLPPKLQAKYADCQSTLEKIQAIKFDEFSEEDLHSEIVRRGLEQKIEEKLKLQELLTSQIEKLDKEVAKVRLKELQDEKDRLLAKVRARKGLD